MIPKGLGKRFSLKSTGIKKSHYKITKESRFLWGAQLLNSSMIHILTFGFSLTNAITVLREKGRRLFSVTKKCIYGLAARKRPVVISLFCDSCCRFSLI